MPALLNLTLGSAYVFIGVLTLVDMRRERSGFSHFGAAMVTLAFTCGPHHLFHGIHIGFEGRPGSGLDAIAVAVGIVPGVAWLYLRVEAFWGGRGDRFVSGTPAWVRAIPVILVAHVALLTVAASRVGGPARFTVAMVPHLLVIGVYLAIAAVLLRTQLANRPVLGGWSASGVGITLLFVTCAPMHALSVAFLSTGRYEFDIHGFAAAGLGVPAGLYFLWVVHGMYRDMFADWRREMLGEMQERVPASMGAFRP